MARRPTTPKPPSIKKVMQANQDMGALVTGMVVDMLDAGLPNASGRKSKPVAKVGPSSAATARTAQTPAPLGMSADVTDELAAGGQAFGDVLKSIGHAVVVSQAALDDAAIETAKALSETKVEIALAIRQHLDEFGNISDAADDAPEVDTRTLSLSNFILPTLHQWEHVAVSMDMTVGEIDATSGIKVKSSGVSVGATYGASGFSAAGEFGYSSTNAESRFKSDFASGSVRFDALLAPREEFRYPEVADFAIGPRILVEQTPSAIAEVPASTNPVVSAKPASRKVSLKVDIKKSDGTVNAGKSVEVRLPADLRRRLVSPPSTIPTGASKDLELKPEFAKDPAQSFVVQLTLGQLSKNVDVYL
jgi:hypothetical protein